MSFYGYESEAQMRAMNPVMADKIAAAAERRVVRVCSKGKRCVGSVDGREFRYADGSRDLGREVVDCRAVVNGDVFRWYEDETDGTPGTASLLERKEEA